MRSDYCPMANHPCMCMCDTPCSAHRLKVESEESFQGDPMDTPLPCDVKIGNCIHRKGTSLRTLVNRAQRLHEAAFGPAPTKEEAAANLEQLRSAVIAPAKASAVDGREPLTPERVDELSHEMVRGNKSVNWLVRAIERAHGIGDAALAQKGGK